MLQRQALAVIASDFLGKSRLPMLIVDTPNVLRPSLSASARGAGVLGFAVCASKRVFALREDMSLDVQAIEEFLAGLNGKPFFLFGFTFVVWKNFYEALKNQKIRLDFSAGTLIHGGGWKKLADEAVPRERFHEALAETCDITRIFDYTGWPSRPVRFLWSASTAICTAAIFPRSLSGGPPTFPCAISVRKASSRCCRYCPAPIRGTA
jgi:hypothetical protein